MIVLDVALRLKELRELRGISVNKLSNMAGLSQSFVREIELGRKNPTVDSLSYLCEALGISLNDFFDRDLVGSIRENRALLAIYRLSPQKQEALLSFIETFLL